MPDRRPATLRDVAAAARVHPATASRALNPETRILVSEETARRVTDAAARLGYRPNPVARSLRTRRSHTIGVLIPDLNNPLFPPIVRGLEDKLAAAGYVALIGNTDADANRERTLFEQMRARHDVSLSHPKVAMIDLMYHDVDRGRGLFYKLQQRDEMERTCTDDAITEAMTKPPETTRARLRGAFVKRAKERRRDFTVDWVHLKLNDQAQRTVLLKDPFKSHDERVERLIQSL
jgi:hypothetical protein